MVGLKDGKRFDTSLPPPTDTAWGKCPAGTAAVGLSTVNHRKTGSFHPSVSQYYFLNEIGQQIIDEGIALLVRGSSGIVNVTEQAGYVVFEYANGTIGVVGKDAVIALNYNWLSPSQWAIFQNAGYWASQVANVIPVLAIATDIGVHIADFANDNDAMNFTERGLRCAELPGALNTGEQGSIKVTTLEKVGKLELPASAEVLYRFRQHTLSPPFYSKRFTNLVPLPTTHTILVRKQGYRVEYSLCATVAGVPLPQTCATSNDWKPMPLRGVNIGFFPKGFVDLRFRLVPVDESAQYITPPTAVPGLSCAIIGPAKMEPGKPFDIGWKVYGAHNPSIQSDWKNSHKFTLPRKSDGALLRDMSALPAEGIWSGLEKRAGDKPSRLVLTVRDGNGKTARCAQTISLAGTAASTLSKSPNLWCGITVDRAIQTGKPFNVRTEIGGGSVIKVVSDWINNNNYGPVRISSSGPFLGDGPGLENPGVWGNIVKDAGDKPSRVVVTGWGPDGKWAQCEKVFRVTSGLAHQDTSSTPLRRWRAAVGVLAEQAWQILHSIIGRF